MAISHTAAVIAASILASGCLANGGGSLGKPVSSFPSRAELDAVASVPLKPGEPLRVESVDSWSLALEGAAASTYPRDNRWDELLVKVAESSRGGLTASPELRCAAIETARFFVQHGGYPTDGLRDHLLGRCGSTLPSAELHTLDVQVPEGTSQKELQALLERAFESRIPELSRYQGGAGLGVAQGNGRASLVLYRGQPQVRLDPWSPLVEGDRFVISGTFLSEASRAIGLITRGRLGVSPCEPDRSVDLPRFVLTCGMAEQDQQARFELVAGRPSEVLMQPMLRLFPRRSEQAGLVYEPTLIAAVDAAGSTESASAGRDFRGQLFASLNRVREIARLSPVTLETRQSEQNTLLASHLYDASSTNDSERTNQIALGLLAGWEVSGTIAGGGIFAQAQGGSRDAERWLADALQSPMGRWTLLDPRISHLAIGSAPLEPNGLQAVVTGYALFGSADHSSDEDRVFELLTELRRARGLSAPLRASRQATMTAVLSKINAGTLSPHSAMDQALRAEVTTTGTAHSAWILETNDLTNLPLQHELMRTQPIEVQVGVTHYKPEGAAWGQYVVLFVIREVQGNLRAEQGQGSVW